MRLGMKVRRLWRGWERLGLYGRPSRSDHRMVKTGHGGQPSYSRKTQRMLTRLFR